MPVARAEDIETQVTRERQPLLSGPNIQNFFAIIYGYAIIVIGLVIIKPYDEKGENDKDYGKYLTGEEWTISTAAWTLFFALLFLLFHRFPSATFSKIHRSVHTFEWIIYLITAIFWIIAAGVEIWATCHYRDTEYLDSSHKVVKLTTRYKMRAAASAFCILEFLIFLGSFYFAKFRAGYTTVNMDT